MPHTLHPTPCPTLSPTLCPDSHLWVLCGDRCALAAPYGLSNRLPTLPHTFLTQIDAEWFRSHVGVVSQDTRLFGSTVAANIAYGFSEQKLMEGDHAAGVAAAAAAAGARSGEEGIGSSSGSNGNGSGSHEPASVTGRNGSATAHELLASPASSSNPGPDSNSNSNLNPSGIAPAEAETETKTAVWMEPPESFTIADSLIPIAATQEQIEEAAREANAHDFIAALPQGYDTPVNDK